MSPDIVFPHLGIQIDHLGKSLNIFGFSIAFYGMIIGLGIIVGASIAYSLAKKDGENLDLYYDFTIIVLILSILGARIYYVIFQWDYYSQHPLEILNIRGGGLAIYGGVLTAAIVAIVFTKVKKMSFFRLADNAVCGLIAGQMIGRWGNFMNREAFGGYTDNLFAMQIARRDVNSAMISESLNAAMKEHPVVINGVEYIQVHPTFLYESLVNLAVLLILLIYRRFRKNSGEMMCIYFVGYGIGRFIIESLRTDQLLIHGTNIPISQVVSICLIAGGTVVWIYRRFLCKTNDLPENARKNSAA